MFKKMHIEEIFVNLVYDLKEYSKYLINYLATTFESYPLAKACTLFDCSKLLKSMHFSLAKIMFI